MPDLSPLRQAVSALRPVFKTQGHDPHPNWGDEGHDPDPQLGVWFTSRSQTGLPQAEVLVKASTTTVGSDPAAVASSSSSSSLF